MSKKYYRFYGGLITAQERWLNRMAAKGLRLISTGKMLYEFEECSPGQFQYRVEFIGQKSKKDAAEYRNFLEDMGYRVFFKNINLNYSAGKVVYCPWAEKGGRISTTSTTYNRELLIVEKEDDGKPLELHTTLEDKQNYYKTMRRPMLFGFLFWGTFAVIMKVWWVGILSAIFLIPLISCQLELARIAKQAKLTE
ncbi:MAG: DUF2812 domain-containing protein [Lachnospiraceae bacterium]|nr:DUF2812 domain-containing protein [Lachnospiraceae bacterium]